MQNIRFYTPKQLQVEKWVNELGFRTELEYPVKQYCLDIYIPELNWGVEVDGSCHVFKKGRDKRRDKRLIEEYGIEHVFRVRNDTPEVVFKTSFVDEVKRIKGECPFEKGSK